MKTFRILIVDDEVYDRAEAALIKTTALPSFEAEHCHFVSGLACKNADASKLEIVVSGDPVFRKCIRLRPQFEKMDSAADAAEFLSNFDVVVLDVAGIGSFTGRSKMASVIKDNLRSIHIADNDLPSDAVIHPILSDKSFDGVAFYHHYLKALRNVRSVIVLTRHDPASTGGGEAPPPVRQCLEVFCADPQSLPPEIPWTIKYGKAEGAGGCIQAIIQSLYDDWSDGYVNLTNRGQIEFAASTDYPVLVLGESGTGKEYVAKAVHRAWVREKPAGQRIPFVVVNCGALSSESAQARLFGQVRGSGGGASGHLPGAILEACGCPSLGIPSLEEDAYLKGALKRATDTADSFNTLAAMQNEATDSATAWRATTKLLFQIRSLIYAGATQHEIESGKEQPKHLLSEVIKEVEWKLRRMLEGAENAEHFKKRLLEELGDVLESVPGADNSFDLRFKDNLGCVGILFLDEFADLSPTAQSLLLRFLEENTREIQPVGYPGRITGIKLRLIAATSDEKVALDAGVEIGRRAGGQARADAIRHDLIQRVRWHVIRVDAVTEKNVVRSLDSMISQAPIQWEADAKEAVKSYVANHPRPETFNHRRELKRIVTLAEHHVRTGHVRGLKDFTENIVTAKIVTRFLNPVSPLKPEVLSSIGSEHSLSEAVERMTVSSGWSEEAKSKATDVCARVEAAIGGNCKLEMGKAFRSQIESALKEVNATNEIVEAVFGSSGLGELTNANFRTKRFMKEALCILFGQTDVVKVTGHVSGFRKVALAAFKSQTHSAKSTPKRGGKK